MMGARKNRFRYPELFQMESPATAIFGLFMLWFGWMGFNCGSTYGVTGGKWKLAAKSAVTTINASIGGGTVSIILRFTKTLKTFFSVKLYITFRTLFQLSSEKRQI